jgi:hypothetical protein
LRNVVLPARVTLADQEALDCFLERLAAANGLQPPTLVKLLSRPEDLEPAKTAFLMIKPDSRVVNRISELSGITTDAVVSATLSRFGDNLPYCLDGFDPRHPRNLVHVASQGWFPRFGSQVCPPCLAGDGIWQLQWRLPIIATCPHHRVFLVTQCIGCGDRFRAYRRTPLRPILEPGQPCANPIAPRNPCQHSVLAHSVEPADSSVLDTTGAILNALAGQPAYMLGEAVDPRLYLAELRHLATLLLHLLSRPAGVTAAPWAHELHAEAARRTTARRGPRWGITAPLSAVVRGQILAQAHQILCQSNLEDAAALLSPWLSLIVGVTGGMSGWLLNRSARTVTMEQLLALSTARRGPVSRQLSTSRSGESLKSQSIPQQIDADIYATTFPSMLNTHEQTGRLYVSLCIARTTSAATNWSEAAACIGLEPAIGIRIARTSSARMRVAPKVFAAAVVLAAHQLPAERDFRRRERRVRELALNPAGWFDTWATSMSPRRPLRTLPYAVTWMWCEVAQGSLGTSPAWPAKPTEVLKGVYRRFRNELPLQAQHDLRALVLDDPHQN